jgi:protocatechuate 3,4-dioxygenase beta subunit
MEKAMMKTPVFPVLSSSHATLGETLRVLDERRRLLKMIGGVGALALLPRSVLGCTLIPTETGGPFPGDGTNGPNVLTQSGIVRSDIRPSFGSSGTAVAPGTQLDVTLQFLSTTTDCGAIEGLAVYLWHCNASGGYSLYSSGVTTQNYLRGMQVTDANGRATFTTVFPGCYSGRWPHMHFEIFASLEDATNGSNAGRTSQLALPEAPSRLVYAQSALYPNSTANLNQITLASDGVFGDDQAAHQLATVSGDNASGYTAFLEVGLAVDATTSDLIFADGFDS